MTPDLMDPMCLDDETLRVAQLFYTICTVAIGHGYQLLVVKDHYYTYAINVSRLCNTCSVDS